MSRQKANYIMPHVTEYIQTVPVDMRLWEFQIDNADAINKLIIDVLQEQGDRKQSSTNVKAQMSEWNMLEYEPFKVVADRAQEVVREWYHTRAGIILNTNVTACWGAVYRKGDYTINHAHLPDSYSFVYYPKAEENCAPLVIQGYSYQPKTGYGLIFPSWADHFVPKTFLDDDRVVVAGNMEVSAQRD